MAAMDSIAMSNSKMTGQRSFFGMIVLCFLLSGFAALLYETVWLREFAIILGTSEQALAVILASYMGGLSIGAWWIGRKIDRIRRPVRLYGILEAAIALCAIAMPWGLDLVESLQVALFGGSQQPPAAGSFSQTMFGLVAAFTLIALPTGMMGATLPLLAKWTVHKDSEVGPKIGFLYGVNTLGAVAGTMTAAFVLLPSLGLWRTTWVGAAVNLGIFLLVLFACRDVNEESESISKLQTDDVDADDIGADDKDVEVINTDDIDANLDDRAADQWFRYRHVIWFVALSGAVSFCYEIVFTRMLSHMLGGSVFAFATMLAGFLLGIAIGGLVASRLAVRAKRALEVLIYSQALAGIFALVAYHSIDQLAAGKVNQWGGISSTSAQIVTSILILLPTATCLGATFPLATRVFARNETEAASASAKIYLFSTIGGIAGALVTGGTLLPSFAYSGTVLIAVLMNAVIALVLVAVMAGRPLHYVAGIVTLILALVWLPRMPHRLLRLSALTGAPVEGDLVFNHVGRSGTVTVFDQQGEFRFMTNGLPEALVSLKGTRDPFRTGTWLGALPVLLQEKTDRMLIVGLGGGVALTSVPPSVKEIDVFELEPAVVAANEFVADKRDENPLADDRVKIILNDGRNGLLLTKKKYDAIVSQPSHPWTAGASHLYTREFAELALLHLQPDGIFLQWMNTEFMDEDLFRSLAATLLDVFTHVRVYEPKPGNCMFVASDAEFDAESDPSGTLALNRVDKEFFARYGVQTASELFSLIRIDETNIRELAKGFPIISDEYNRFATRAPQLLHSDNSKAMKKFLDVNSPFTSSTRMEQLCPSIELATLTSRFSNLNLRLPESTLKELADSKVELNLLESRIARLDGDRDRWLNKLREAAAADPKDPQPAFLLLAHAKFNTIGSLSEERKTDLESRLDDRREELYQAVVASMENDMQGVREREKVLASFDTSDFEYEVAVRLRLLWRITRHGPRQQKLCMEALEIISRATPFMSLDALIRFRVAAAIGADRPNIAVPSTLEYTKGSVIRITSKEQVSLAKLRSIHSNIVSCRQLMSEPRRFKSIDRDLYQSTIDYLDRAIAGDIE